MSTIKISFAFCCRRQLCELRNYESNVLEHEVGATDEIVPSTNDDESVDAIDVGDDAVACTIGIACTIGNESGR